MSPNVRRIVHAVLYETIAVVVIGPALGLVFDQPPLTTLPLVVFMSTVALGWNVVFNGLFERWESRQADRTRTPWRRLLHGIGFEGGLVVMLVPVMAWWLDTTILAAFVADLGVLGFFLVYAIAYTWAFDKVFGLPASTH